jgi:hypothetical protein
MKYRRRRKSGDASVSGKDNTQGVDTVGSYLNELIKGKIDLASRARQKAIELTDNHCSYCKKQLDKSKGEGRIVFNRNSGYRHKVNLCTACFSVRAKRQRYLSLR